MTSADPTPQVFDVKSLCERWLNCKRDVVYALIASGQLSAFNIAPPGSKRPTWRIRGDEVVRFETNGAAEPVKKRRKAKAARPTDYVKYY